MADIKNLELTKDPLTNIKLMVPMLNEESRKAVSYLMFGFYLSERCEANKNKEAG